jgi:hypothetical protein
MITNSMKIFLFIISFFSASVFLTSCVDGHDNVNLDNNDDNEEVDRSKSTLLTINGEIFSIPSPIQTALLIKEVGANYDKEILNDPSNVSAYSTKFQKAINLGVLGADLGYVTIYDQTQDAISYFKSVRDIANDLGIIGAFDSSLMERFERNMGKQDSILILVSDAYRASDSYLKEIDRNDVGVFVLAGGFIESLYFATHAAKQSNNTEVIKRIGEQKTSLENLIRLLSPYYGKEEVKAFADELIDLAGLFDNIEYIYIYEKPTVDAANKTTTINSRSEIKISSENLSSITKKVNEIRNQLTKK